MDVAELLATASVYHDALAVGDPNAETLAADLGVDFEMRQSRRDGWPRWFRAQHPNFTDYYVDTGSANVSVKMPPELVMVERARCHGYNEWLHEPRWNDSSPPVVRNFDAVLREYYADDRLRQAAESDNILVRLRTDVNTAPSYNAILKLE